MVHQHQEGYYQAINKSTLQSDSTPFILFILLRIKEALASVENTDNALITPPETPQEAQQVTPQVIRLLQNLTNTKSRIELQKQLGLTDRKSFNKVYLQPALEQGLIEMTFPDKPQSKLQQYRITATGKALLLKTRSLSENSGL